MKQGHVWETIVQQDYRTTSCMKIVALGIGRNLNA
jgi:hypothetical protein